MPALCVPLCHTGVVLLPPLRYGPSALLPGSVLLTDAILESLGILRFYFTDACWVTWKNVGVSGLWRTTGGARVTEKAAQPIWQGSLSIMSIHNPLEYSGTCNLSQRESALTGRTCPLRISHDTLASRCPVRVKIYLRRNERLGKAGGIGKLGDSTATKVQIARRLKSCSEPHKVVLLKSHSQQMSSFCTDLHVFVTINEWNEMWQYNYGFNYRRETCEF